MKRVLLTVAVALLIPSLLSAAPVTIGVYYEGGLTVSPIPYTNFRVGLYMVQAEYDMTAVEYRLAVKDNLGVEQDPTFGMLRYDPSGKVLAPKVQTELGDPMTGHTINFWPPMNGFPHGYDWLCDYQFYLFGPGAECGPITNWTIEVVEHPTSGYLRGAYYPDGEKVDLIGLALYVCPLDIGVEEESWGAIKSLYR